MRFDNAVLGITTKVQDLQQKLQLGGNQKSPESIRSLVGEPQQVSQVSGPDCNDPDTQQNNFTIRVIISQFPRGRLEIMRA